MSDYQFNPNVEQWKEIPGFPGYEVSDHGRVRSFRKRYYPGGYRIGVQYVLNPLPQIILKPTQDKNGYAKIRLSKGGKPFDFKAHQLVLLAFVGPCPEGMEGCHNDGTKKDHLPNLRWDTPKNNQHDRRKHGTDIYGYGENHSQAKITEKDVVKIRQLSESGHSGTSIASFLHIKDNIVYSVIEHKTWKHVP